MDHRSTAHPNDLHITHRRLTHRTSKSTILRAIKSGRLSATRKADATYEIDAAELERVYPANRVKRNGSDHSDHRAASAELDAFREILRRADAVALELREDRDKWRSMAEGVQLLLTDKRPWWRRLAGGLR